VILSPDAATKWVDVTSGDIIKSQGKKQWRTKKKLRNINRLPGPEIMVYGTSLANE